MKIEIESTDGVFMRKLIDFLNDYPKVEEDSTVIRVLDKETKTPIQQMIADYGRHAGGTLQYSKHSLQCFVDMIETGEATFHDFRMVGGEELCNSIACMRRAMDKAREICR